MLDVYPELDIFFGIRRTSETTQYDINDNNLWSKDLGTSENQTGSDLVAEPKLEQLEPKKKLQSYFAKALPLMSMSNSLNITEAKSHLDKPVCWPNIGLEKLICDLKSGQWNTDLLEGQESR